MGESKIPKNMSIAEKRQKTKDSEKKKIKRIMKGNEERRQLAVNTTRKVKKEENSIVKTEIKKEDGTAKTEQVRKFASKFARGKLTLDDREKSKLLKDMIDSETLRSYKMTPKRTMEEYFFIALANLSDYVDWDKDGRLFLKSKNELTREQTAAIREINTRRDHATGNYFVTKLKFHDKLTALSDIAKHFGLFEKDNTQKSPQLDIDKIINSLPGELNELVRVKLIKEMAKYAEQQDESGRGLFGSTDEGSDSIN